MIPETPPMRCLRAAPLLLLLTAVGCAEVGRVGGILSRSSSESSYFPMVNSAGASAKSSQRSSGNTPQDVARRYKDDVCAYTATAAHETRNREEFLRGLGAVATEHGLTDWERFQSTYVGIGCGIVRGNLTRENAQVFVAALVGNDPERLNAIAWGMRTEQQKRAGQQEEANRQPSPAAPAPRPRSPRHR